MKTAIIILCGVFAAGSACKAESKVAPHVEDGLSAVTAVVLKPGSIEEGVASEEAWLQKHYPGFRRCSTPVAPAKAAQEGEEIISFAHHTDVVGGRMISAVCVALPDGKEREFFFDITDCYTIQKKTANQALVPMPTSVTAPAGQEPRQP
jgi:hypothetical protein